MIKKLIKRLAGALVLLGLAAVIACLAVSRCMVQETAGQIAEEGSLQGYDAVLVLGAGVREDGSPEPMLCYRMETGITLFQEGAGEILFLTGDSEKPSYDEISAMLTLAEEAGVPAEEILADRYGLCTYDSLWRAARVYGLKRVVIVTQRYHLYRALYYADRLGLDAVGVPAEDMFDLGQAWREAREILARVKAVLWCMTMPDPAYTAAEP